MKPGRTAPVVLILCAIGLAIWFGVLRKPGIQHARADLADKGSERSTTPLPAGSGLSGEQNALAQSPPGEDSGQTQPGYKIADLPSGIAQGLSGADSASTDVRSLSLAGRVPYIPPPICAKDRPDTLSPPGWQVTMVLHNPERWEFAPAAATVATDEIWNGSQSVRIRTVEIAGLVFWQGVDARPSRGKWVDFSALIRLAPRRGNGIAIFAYAAAGQPPVRLASGAGRVELNQSAAPWTRYSAILYVPEGSDVLVYGFQAPGDAWIDYARVSVVDDPYDSRFHTLNRGGTGGGPSMPLPPELILPAPTNLDFELPGIPITEAATKDSARCKTSQQQNP